MVNPGRRLNALTEDRIQMTDDRRSEAQKMRRAEGKKLGGREADKLLSS
jgi:hypothetical protein